MILTITLLALGLLPASRARSPQNDVQALERLETEWNLAHVRGDATALNRIFGDDVVIPTPASDALALIR